MECMELKICMSGKHHRYYKHTKFRQNPRGDPKFLVDLTRNDPIQSFKRCLKFARRSMPHKLGGGGGGVSCFK